MRSPSSWFNVRRVNDPTTGRVSPLRARRGSFRAQSVRGPGQAVRASGDRCRLVRPGFEVQEGEVSGLPVIGEGGAWQAWPRPSGWTTASSCML